MSIATVANSIVDTVKTAAVAVFSGIKNAVLWSGRTVSSGFNNYLVPAVKAVWDRILPLLQTIGGFIKTAAVTTVNALRTGFGLGGTLVAAGATLFFHGSTQNDWSTRITEQVAGVILIAGGVGLAVAFKAARVA